MSCADWSGYVPPPNSRKYIPPKPSKIEGGVGNDADWKPNRKVFSEKTTNSTTHILGGPVPITNPSVVSSCAWETESQSAQQKVKTSQEQLTESGRSMFIRGKASTTPAYELARPFSESVGARLRLENPYDLNENIDNVKNAKDENNPPADCEFSLVGYRSGCGAKSFLKGLGSQVAGTLAKE